MISRVRAAAAATHDATHGLGIELNPSSGCAPGNEGVVVCSSNKIGLLMGGWMERKRTTSIHSHFSLKETARTADAITVRQEMVKVSMERERFWVVSRL